MIKLVAKQKIGFRNPETQEIVTAEPYAFSTFPDWVEKDPMYGWALADGVIEVAGDSQEDVKMMRPPADGDGEKKSSGKNSGKKMPQGDVDKDKTGDNPPADGDGEKKE